MFRPTGRVTRIILAALASSPALLATAELRAQEEQLALFPADAEAAHFGASLDVSGRWAVVAAPGTRRSEVPQVRGAAYIFERGDESRWEQQARILPAPGPAGTFRVAQVAIDRRTVVISGTEQTRAGEMGVAHVYMRHGRTRWLPRAVLRSGSVAQNDGFGSALGLHEDVVLVGADAEGEGAGAAYLFQRDDGGEWRRVARLLAQDAHAGARFGSSVALHDDIALVGSYGCDRRRGAAYVFVRDGNGVWRQEAKLSPDREATRALFGAALAVNGSYALIGAPGEQDFAGAAYLFRRSPNGEWTRSARLRADDGLAFDQFGISVALARNMALIGANHGDHSGAVINGAAYVFEQRGADWTQQRKLESPLTGEKNEFGRQVALTDDAGLVGANKIDDGAGAAFPLPCTEKCPPD
jgi:hypothetical protein